MTSQAKVPCSRITHENTPVSEGFGVFDGKGKEVGARAYSCTTEFVPNGQADGYVSVPGVYYFANVQMTRGGSDFGASHRAHRFDTAAERDTYIVKQMAVSRKNAVKKYA